jgi:hypothetical protein
MQARTASAHSSGVPRVGLRASRAMVGAPHQAAAGQATAVKLQTKLMAEYLRGTTFVMDGLSKTEGTIKHVSEEP